MSEKQIYVEVPLKWLRILDNYCRSISKEPSTFPMSISVSKLIGFASSVESIIKHNERV